MSKACLGNPAPCLPFFTGFVQDFKRLEIFQFLEGPFLALEKGWKMGEICPGSGNPTPVFFFSQGLYRVLKGWKCLGILKGLFWVLKKYWEKGQHLYGFGNSIDLFIKQYRLDQNLEIFAFL